jgi:hypothetical protein
VLITALAVVALEDIREAVATAPVHTPPVRQYQEGLVLAAAAVAVVV